MPDLDCSYIHKYLYQRHLYSFLYNCAACCYDENASHHWICKHSCIHCWPWVRHILCYRDRLESFVCLTHFVRLMKLLQWCHMSVMTFQITFNSTDCSTGCSVLQQRKQECSVFLAPRDCCVLAPLVIVALPKQSVNNAERVSVPWSHYG